MKIPIVNNYNYDEVVGHIKGNEIILRDELKIDMRKHYLSLGFQIKKLEVLPNGDLKPVKMEKEKDAEIAELKNEIDELNGQISEM